MSEYLEVISENNPVEILTGHIALRGAELEHLATLLVSAMETVSDMGRINEVLANSERPELVMTRRVPQLYGDSPDDLGKINNFTPKMRSFGVREFGESTSPLAREGEEVMIGRRPYAEHERAVVQLLSGHEDYHGFLKFAAEQDVDKDFAHEVLMMTHAKKRSFARMLIICPELTWYLIDTCLHDVSNTKLNKLAKKCT